MQPLDKILSTRRHFLASNVMNLSAIALPFLLQQQTRAEPSKPDLTGEHFDLEPKSLDHEPRAKAMISLWMQGGPSHIDLFDPKPILQRRNGELFKQYGESGIALSELLPGLSKRVDDITLIRSMRTGVNNHGQSIRAMHNGTTIEGQPSLGSWLSYGLGSETRSLPAFCALIDPGQLPVLGVENWSNGYLPSLFQGTVIRPHDPRILNLAPPVQLQGTVQKNYHHGNIRTSLPAACRKVDKPSAALITDLKRRGLLDSTVVHWGGEMGRLPVIQNDAGHSKVGRDHNTYGFSMWVAGGGFQSGCAYGNTDEFGHEAVENVVNHYDYHATLLHLFGLNPDRLVYEQNARKRTLTENHSGRIIQEILA